MAQHYKEPLPSWFSKQNYIACKNFDLKTWWVEIGRRKAIFDHIRGTDEELLSFAKPSSINPEYYHIIDEDKFTLLAQEAADKKTKDENLERHIVTDAKFRYLNFIVKHISLEKLIEDKIIIRTAEHMLTGLLHMPIFNISEIQNLKNDNLITNYFSFGSYGHLPCGDIEFEYSSLKTNSVNLVTWRDTIHIYEKWCREEDIQKAVNHTWRSDKAADDEDLCKKAYKPIDLDISGLNCAHINIDLSASDPQILKDFKVFLKKYRKSLENSNPAPKEITKNKLQKFYKYNLLAVMDLYLYGLLKNKKLENKFGVANIASAVFFDEIIESIDNKSKSDTDNVSRTYQEQAKVTAMTFLKNDITYNSLLHQVF